MIERLKRSLPAIVWNRYSSANGPLYATVVAFNALFSIFPILLALLFTLGVILPSESTLSQISSAIARFLPSGIASEIVDVLRASQQQAGLLGLVSLIGLLWAASSLFGTLAKGFNRVYGVPDRPTLREKIMSLAMMLLFILLLLISLAATVIAHLLLEIGDLLPVQESGWAVAGMAFSFLLSLGAAFALCLSIYWIVPNVEQGPKDVWPGAIFAALLFVLLMQVFPIYVRLFAGFQRYGTLFGFSFLALTWLYFVAQVLMLGAALNAVRANNARARSVL